MSRSSVKCKLPWNALDICAVTAGHDSILFRLVSSHKFVFTSSQLNRRCYLRFLVQDMDGSLRGEPVSTTEELHVWSFEFEVGHAASALVGEVSDVVRVSPGFYGTVEASKLASEKIICAIYK